MHVSFLIHFPKIFLNFGSKSLQIGKLIIITNASATKAYIFLATLNQKVSYYKKYSTPDLITNIPIAVPKIITTIEIISSINGFPIFLTNLKVNPIIIANIRLPQAQPGIPLSPPITKQYKITPNVPTNVPLITPIE